MKGRSAPTNFARCVTRFLTCYLPGERNLSAQTIRSYSLALRMYISYIDSSAGIKPERIELNDIAADSIKGFLASIGDTRHISPNTHNQAFQLSSHLCAMPFWNIQPLSRTANGYLLFHQCTVPRKR